MTIAVGLQRQDCIATAGRDRLHAQRGTDAARPTATATAPALYQRRAARGVRRVLRWLGAGIAYAALLHIAACSFDSSHDAATATGVTESPTSPPSDPGTAGPDTDSPLVDGAAGFAMSGNLKIHYEVHGEGRPLVLVHGWGANIRYNWQVTGWLEALQPLRQVIAIDIRGHGDSDKPHVQAAYGYAAMADDILAVMDHLGIAQADYVGYSLGAFTGAHLMGHAPGRFSSFALMGIGDEDAASLALAPRIAAALRAPTADEVTDPEALIYRILVDLDPRNDREALALAALEMWPQGYPIEVGGPGLAHVGVPVLVVNGANDPYAATDDAFVAAVPGAELVEVPGVDHFGLFTDPAFKDAIVAFLSAR